MSIQPDPEFAARSQPSPEIDSAICDLISHITSYTDADFDTESMHVTEREVELLIIHLLMSLTTIGIGKRLGEYLLSIREGQGEFCEQTPHPENRLIDSDLEEIIAQLRSSGEFLFPDVF